MTDNPRPSGDRGDLYRPDKCNHTPGDGCEWCCQRCNYDRHFCPGCGTVTDHKETVCPDCVRELEYSQLEDPRDRTAFVEYFHHWDIPYCITSVWHNDGRLDYFIAGRDFATSKH